MKKIPTARSFYQNYIEENNNDSHVDVEEMLIEFAKLHVKQALKEASEKAKLTDFACEFLQEGAPDSIDRKSILNSYSSENIK